MNNTTHGFTLIEILIALGICMLLGSFASVESISSFQFSLEQLHRQSDALQQEVFDGQLLRHITTNSSAPHE